MMDTKRKQKKSRGEKEGKRVGSPESTSRSEKEER
jgi:hypothetical protein